LQEKSKKVIGQKSLLTTEEQQALVAQAALKVKKGRKIKNKKAC
jgi:hypothetical protein